MSEGLSKNGIIFKKSLGQNFIFDKNLLAAIATDAAITSCDTVIEVGAGAGTLTAAIAAAAKKVISIEIDTSLQPHLAENLKNSPNVQLVFADILKLKPAEIKQLAGDNPIKIVANLPYYITTPVIFHFLESDLDIQSMTLTVQKEVALRMTAAPATADFGALTLAIAARANAKITRHIGRNMFMPAPAVDSAVVRLDIVRPFDRQLSRVIKSLFAMRRKTAANNLMQAFSLTKAQAESALESIGVAKNIRGEQLDLAQVTALKNSIFDR